MTKSNTFSLSHNKNFKVHFWRDDILQLEYDHEASDKLQFIGTNFPDSEPCEIFSHIKVGLQDVVF